MAATKLYGKSLKEYEDIDVDALLSQLTEEELEQLGQDLIDPDVSLFSPCILSSLEPDSNRLSVLKRHLYIGYLGSDGSTIREVCLHL